MTDHTATPWKAVPNGGDDPDTRALLIGKDDQYGDFTMIAEARDFFGEVDGDQEANAAFIVQACNAYDSDQRIIAELRAGLEAIANGKAHCGTPARYVKDIAAETLAKAAS